MTTINDMTKQQVFELVKEAKEQLGTMKRVGRKCDVSEASISLILNPENWHHVREKMWYKVGIALGWRPEGWTTVRTLNTNVLFQIYADAKTRGMWFAVSNPAGSGKTESARQFKMGKREVFYLQCREWHKRQFAHELARLCGISLHQYTKADVLIPEIISFFKLMHKRKPLLIIDEADKLSAAAMRILIPLYNDLEGILGMVIQGTQNLKKQIETGVRRDQKGMDEIYSRFGRQFINLLGCPFEDVKKICTANGVGDKRSQNNIFKACKPTYVHYEGKDVLMVKDLRQLKRKVNQQVLINIENTVEQLEKKEMAEAMPV